MTAGTAPLGDVTIAYEAAGDPEASAVLLINGLGHQLVWWPMPFVDALAIAGHRVVRFDNRDVGRSTHLSGTPRLSGLRETVAAGRPVDVPYRLADMARDAVGLLDHLGIARAHVVGVSMGGAIAQHLAIDHGDRVRTLTIVMSSTGDPAVGGWNARGGRALFRAPPLERDGAVASTLDAWELLAPPGLFDRTAARLTVTRQIDRAFDPAGVGRQLAAIWAEPDRTPRLSGITTPTLVVHGSVDPLVDVSGGRAVAAAVPGATYVEIEGMGHELAERHWPDVLGPLLAHLAAG